MSTVLFLTGETMGDACGSSGRSIRNEFEELGYEFLEVNFSQPDPVNNLNRIIGAGSIEFVYSFVGMCADFEATTADGKQKNLWEAIGTPFISLYGDSPAYFFDRHVLPGRGFASLYAFNEHMELRKRLPESRGLIGVLPPAIGDAVPKSAINFLAKERGRLLFLKNGNDPDALVSAWRESLSATIFLMISDLAGELAGKLDSEIPNDIDSLVCSYFRNQSLDIGQLTNLRLFFVAQLDDYCRRLKSTLITEVLLDFPIEVHGFNWEHVDFSKRRAKLIPSADYNVSRALMREALGVIDMSPNTSITPHDRPRRAFGSYTLCLTNEQNYFASRFPNFAEFSFRFDKESIQSKVADALANPRRYVELGIEIAESYRSSQESNSTGRFLLDTASILRMEQSPGLPNLQNYFVWPPSKLR